MNDNENLVNRYLLDAMWKNLPDYFEDKNETGLCVVDVSGSMSGTPMEVAISLGMYCADKAKGPFANHFITFSSNPALVNISGDNIFDKVKNIGRSDWGMNTNLERVFKLILSTAVKNHTPQEDMPSKLYIISDMQFDAAMGCRTRYDWDTDTWLCPNPFETETFMETMRKKFEAKGYKLPAIVYWNVNASECGMFQDTFDAGNCCMVSGYSPSLFKAVIEGTEYEEEVLEDGSKVVREVIDPMTIMLNTLNNERYDRVYTGD